MPTIDEQIKLLSRRCDRLISEADLRRKLEKSAKTGQPLRIDWKPAGDDPDYYRLVRNYEVLPDLQPRAGVAGWEFRSEVIWLTNCSIAVDLRIRGEFGRIFLPKESRLRSHRGDRMGTCLDRGRRQSG